MAGRSKKPGKFSCGRCGRSQWIDAGEFRRCRECHNERRVLARQRRRAAAGLPPLQSRWSSSAERERDRWLRRRDWLASGDCTSADLKQIFQANGGLCAYCGSSVPRPGFRKSAPRGFDHVLPRVLGGRHTKSNIVVACSSCNTKKNATHPENFAPGLLARLAGVEAN